MMVVAEDIKGLLDMLKFEVLIPIEEDLRLTSSLLVVDGALNWNTLPELPRVVPFGAGEAVSCSGFGKENVLDEVPVESEDAAPAPLEENWNLKAEEEEEEVSLAAEVADVSSASFEGAGVLRGNEN